MTEELKKFLYQASTRGYGNAQTNQEKLPNGENVIRFQDGDFEFKDIYYGGEPYAGQEVIFAKGRAVWAMQYRGSVINGEDFAPIYAFLGKTLTGTEIGLPRGKNGFTEGEFAYNFEMNGDLQHFSAREKITKNGKVVYSAECLGGLVDLKRED